MKFSWQKSTQSLTIFVSKIRPSTKLSFFETFFGPNCNVDDYTACLLCILCDHFSLSFLSHSLSLSSLIPSLPFASDRERYLMWEPTKFFGAFAQKKKIGETNPFHQNEINKCTNFVIYKIKLINSHTEHSRAWWKKIVDICFSCFKKWQKTVNDVVLNKKLTKQNTKTNDRFFAECAIANKVKKEKIQEK